MKRFAFAIICTIALASIADAHGYGQRSFSRSFSYGRSYGYAQAAVYASAAIYAAPVVYAAPIVYAAPLAVYAAPLPTYQVQAQAVPCVPQVEAQVQSAPVASCQQTAQLFQPSYAAQLPAYSAPVYAQQLPAYSVQRSVYAAQLPAYSVGVSRNVYASRNAVIVRQRGIVRADVIAGGGTSVVINQQRGLFSRSRTTVVAGGGGGANVVVNQQRGIFRR